MERLSRVPAMVSEGDRDGQLTLRTGPGNVYRVAPKQVEKPSRVCVRSLRTQQCTESQCQFVWVLGLSVAVVVVGGSGVQALVLLL